jgi:uncharacterized protein (TIGR02271 family)
MSSGRSRGGLLQTAVRLLDSVYDVNADRVYVVNFRIRGSHPTLTSCKETTITISTEQLQSLDAANGNVVNAQGDKIGGIGQIYVDDTTGAPSWVTVKTGLFGTSESFVPLEGASLAGSDIQVGYDKDKVKGAPRIDADGALSPEEEETLYQYYGLSGSGVGRDDYAADRTTTTTGGDAQYDANAAGVGTGTVGRDHDDDDRGLLDKAKDKLGRDNDNDRENRHGTTGHDTSGPTTDDAMTLSEERVNVGTQTRESGRARLRKYVVTENVQQTVPVSHEEVRIEREPITDANVGAATSGPTISEEEHEVVLHEERPVVEKEAVPVERVRLDTETVTDQTTVNEEVRKEQVDTDVDVDRNAR